MRSVLARCHRCQLFELPVEIGERAISNLAGDVGDRLLRRHQQGAGLADPHSDQIVGNGHAHVAPEQAVQMANEGNVEYFMPVHHKTFPIGKEPIEEPIQRLDVAIEKQRVALREIGETFVLA